MIGSNRVIGLGIRIGDHGILRLNELTLNVSYMGPLADTVVRGSVVYDNSE